MENCDLFKISYRRRLRVKSLIYYRDNNVTKNTPSVNNKLNDIIIYFIEDENRFSLANLEKNQQYIKPLRDSINEYLRYQTNMEESHDEKLDDIDIANLIEYEYNLEH